MLNRLIGASISLSVDIKEENYKILANPTMLEQVLINLVNNSKDAMPNGGDISITLDKMQIYDNKIITAQCEALSGSDQYESYHSKNFKNGNYFSLLVKDTGMGMNREILDYIYEPFFTTKIAGKGTGLGLSTVYGIISDFNGYIGVTSKVNVGTIFHILIPIVKNSL